ncbi:hypothetical protein M5K25_008124 [Dendrobium thyrsiflorum]|uniref:Uncharacterized protein n=1 Tax=Dendrobium thyrsiflorum TaxID=117978 RepID=A0ABD0V7X9_DENTH
MHDRSVLRGPVGVSLIPGLDLLTGGGIICYGTRIVETNFSMSSPEPTLHWYHPQPPPQIPADWKRCQQTKDRELHHHIDDPLPKTSIDFDGQCMVRQNEDSLRKSNVYDMDVQRSEMHHHYRGLPMDPYNDLDRKSKVYSRDSSLPDMHSFQQRLFIGTSSTTTTTTSSLYPTMWGQLHESFFSILPS